MKIVPQMAQGKVWVFEWTNAHLCCEICPDLQKDEKQNGEDKWVQIWQSSKELDEPVFAKIPDVGHLWTQGKNYESYVPHHEVTYLLGHICKQIFVFRFWIINWYLCTPFATKIICWISCLLCFQKLRALLINPTFKKLTGLKSP